MTPKEKAKELYDKYEFVYIQNYTYYTSKHEVIECAIIAVDEILDSCIKDISHLHYWVAVKSEIEKL